MQRNKILLSINGGDKRSCRNISYIMVSNGKDEFAIRATTRATRYGVESIMRFPKDFPVINLENCGCSFTHAYEGDIVQTDGFTVLEQAKFLHDQRMKLAEMLGPIKFAEIDYVICRAIREFHR